MSGGDDEILAYLEAYKNGARTSEVQERAAYLDAKAKNSKKVFGDFMGRYNKSRYSEEIKTLMSKVK